MGTKERRERERQETRTRIMDAARDLFVRDGLEAVTMRAIADRIEYTPTAIYHHFRDKYALLLELCQHDFRALASAFQRIERVDDPVQRLTRLGEAYVRFGLEHPSQYRFMFMTAGHLQGLEKDIEKGNPQEDAYAFLLTTVQDALAAGRFRPEYRDANLLAQMLWAGVHGIVSLHILHEKDDWIAWHPPGSTAHEMMAAMMRGLLRPH